MRPIDSTGETGTLEETLKRFRVPEHLHEGLIEYVMQGRPTGGFLHAVLSNDLAQACSRADPDSAASLFHIVRWLYNEAPNPCWGSAKNVNNWLQRHAAEREAARCEGISKETT